MEKPINKLTEIQEDFFEKIKNYIDKPIYFYGSIQRNDYFPGKSDIDIAIFTENEFSTITKLSNLLNLSKNDFRKSVYKIDNKILFGYKTKYVDENNSLNVEISLYNEKIKDLIIKEQSRNLVVSFHIYLILVFLKFLYYDLQIISTSFFKNCKRFLMNENNEQKYILLDN
jgi:predicted nucleotidyltransferase